MTVKTMVTGLFLSLFAFMFLSAELANSIGLGTYRIYVFSAITGLLVAVSLIVQPFLMRAYKGLFAILGLLLLTIVAFHADKPLHPLDFKIVLPLMIIAAAPNIAVRVRHLDLPVVFWSMLTLFVALASLPLIIAGSGSALTGYGDYQRYDSTGSVITLASLATVLVVITPAFFRTANGPWLRGAILVVGFWGLVMVMMTATRTAILTMALAWLLTLMVEPDRQRTLAFGMVAVTCGIAAFVAFTLWVSDSFYLRLIGSGDVTDYTSGRLHSLEYWLGLVAEHPVGLGIGRVRELMGEARPVLDDGMLLEWPHNEFVRFLVEGGLIGLVFMIVLVGGLARIGLDAAVHAPDPRYRAVITAIIADLVAQSMLQNYFNSIYHATVLITVLLIACQNGRGGVAVTVGRTPLQARDIKGTLHVRDGSGSPPGQFPAAHADRFSRPRRPGSRAQAGGHL